MTRQLGDFNEPSFAGAGAAADSDLHPGHRRRRRSLGVKRAMRKARRSRSGRVLSTVLLITMMAAVGVAISLKVVNSESTSSSYTE
jgi:hypothetical protein